jgi:hypothetical protein
VKNAVIGWVTDGEYVDLEMHKLPKQNKKKNIRPVLLEWLEWLSHED